MSLSSTLFNAITKSTRGFIESRKSAYLNSMDRFSTVTSCICDKVDSLGQGRLRATLESIGQKACEVVVGCEKMQEFVEKKLSLRETVGETKRIVSQEADTSLTEESGFVRQLGQAEDRAGAKDQSLFGSSREITERLNKAVSGAVFGIVQLYRSMPSKKVMDSVVDPLIADGIVYAGDLGRRQASKFFERLKFPKLNLAKGRDIPTELDRPKVESNQVERSVDLLGEILDGPKLSVNDERRVIALCDLLRYSDEKTVREAIARLGDENKLRRLADDNPTDSIKKLLSWEVEAGSPLLKIGGKLFF